MFVGNRFCCRLRHRLLVKFPWQTVTYRPPLHLSRDEKNPFLLSLLQKRLKNKENCEIFEEIFDFSLRVHVTLCSKKKFSNDYDC